MCFAQYDNNNLYLKMTLYYTFDQEIEYLHMCNIGIGVLKFSSGLLPSNEEQKSACPTSHVNYNSNICVQCKIIRKRHIFTTVWSHLYECVLTVSIKAVPLRVKGLVVSISVHLTHPGTWLVFAVPLTLITDTVRQREATS